MTGLSRFWSMSTVYRVVCAALAALALLILVPGLISAATGGAISPRQIVPIEGLAVPVTGFVLMVFLAHVGERLSEYFIKPVIMVVSESIEDPRLRKWADIVERFICAIPGGGLVILLKIDIFGFMGLTMDWPWGMIITAFVVGGGANLVHEFMKAKPEEIPVANLFVTADTHG